MTVKYTSDDLADIALSADNEVFVSLKSGIQTFINKPDVVSITSPIYFSVNKDISYFRVRSYCDRNMSVLKNDDSLFHVDVLDDTNRFADVVSIGDQLEQEKFIRNVSPVVSSVSEDFNNKDNELSR